MGYLMPKPFFKRTEISISSKVNVILQVELELACYDVTVQRDSH